ncbi:hypothetical protein D3C87_1192450 [compost metagenome]
MVTSSARGAAPSAPACRRKDPACLSYPRMVSSLWGRTPLRRWPGKSARRGRSSGRSKARVAARAGPPRAGLGVLVAVIIAVSPLSVTRAPGMLQCSYATGGVGGARRVPLAFVSEGARRGPGAGPPPLSTIANRVAEPETVLAQWVVWETDCFMAPRMAENALSMPSVAISLALSSPRTSWAPGSRAG